MCDVAGVCDSLLRVLPNLQGNLPVIRLFTQDINIPDQCVLKLALSLRKSIAMHTYEVGKHYYNRLKYLYFYDKMDLSLASSIVQVLKTKSKKCRRLLI